MIEIWQAQVKVEIPGHIYPFHDLDVKQILYSQHLLKLGAIYYFYINDPKDPIIIGQDLKNTRTHPGLTRFIGMSLRDTETWANAIIYADSPKSYISSIRWLNLLTTIKEKDVWSEIQNKHPIDKTYVSSQLSSTLVRHSLDARIEIISEREKKLIFNPRGRWLLSEHIQDHNGMIPTLKYIFKKVNEIKTQNQIED